MALEQKLQQRVMVRRKLPSSEVLEQVRRGSKFVVVEDDFEEQFVPAGYTLISMRYKGDVFRSLVPQRLLYFMANPGEGDFDQALDEIADFYGEAEDYEDDLIQNGGTSVQEANYATTARTAYATYLINKLVTTKRGQGQGDENMLEFDPEVIRELDLDDPYVAQRVRGMAALALGKTGEELKSYDINGILKHYSGGMAAEEKIENGEFRKITKMRYKPQFDSHTKTMRCLADSHYYLKPEFENDPEWDYDLRTMTKKRKVDQVGLDAKIQELETQIEEHRKKKHAGEIGRHDRALTRQYANLSYITKEKPKAQLDVQPPEKVGE